MYVAIRLLVATYVCQNILTIPVHAGKIALASSFKEHLTPDTVLCVAVSAWLLALRVYFLRRPPCTVDGEMSVSFAHSARMLSRFLVVDPKQISLSFSEHPQRFLFSV